ncbi:D-arabinono-1,4-lactone oxidase [Arthrobacter psychrolactophilus]
MLFCAYHGILDPHSSQENPFSPRPHWGKVSAMPHSDLRRVYPRLADFESLAARVDPEQTFHNAFLEWVLFGG